MDLRAIEEMKINYRGLLAEPLPSGHIRWRVRVEGKPSRRITLPVDPEHIAFMEYYNAARAGVVPDPPEIVPEPENKPIDQLTIADLTHMHLKHMAKQVEAGNVSALTLKKRTGLYQRLRNQYGGYGLDMPKKAVIALRDEMAATPASADSMVEAIRMLFDWAIEREFCEDNPAIGVKTIDRGKGGAVPWTLDDVRKYIETHPEGTRAHKTLVLMLFTACRIGDAIWLGYDEEFKQDGQTHIGWQPTKKGSAYVEVIMTPQLWASTRSGTVRGKTYLLNHKGQPYRTADHLGQEFRKWTRAAGLENRTAHGVRKGAAGIMAEMNCSQYHIMAVLGHTEAKTSEVYTKGANRRVLAREAIERLASIKL